MDRNADFASIFEELRAEEKAERAEFAHMSAADWDSKVQALGANACGCVGPQNGQPLCPCQMRDVKVVNGRYVRIQDFGPAPADDAFCKRHPAPDATRAMVPSASAVFRFRHGGGSGG